jgi:hypothetical protein
MKIFISISILLTISTSLVVANEKEIWDCKDPNSEWNKILVTATADKMNGEGIIKVAGVEHSTKFEVAGFDRQWKFGKTSVANKYKYVFRIKPNGVAHYFNMTVKKTGGAIESEMVLLCKIRGSGWSIKLQQKEKENNETEEVLLPCLPGFFIMNYEY